MSRPLDQQSPPDFVLQQTTNTHTTHGSIGAVIAVLVVVIILGVAAVIIGRLCSGRSIMGYGHYDLETWAETKCSSCIDGRINPKIPRANVSQIQQEGQSSQTPPPANA